MGSAADDVASNVIAKWSAAFAKLDADALCQLYSRHALFYGSNPTLYRGRDGVKAYRSAALEFKERAVHRCVNGCGRC
jgi:ketosteroid isomerase-like protein